MNDKQTWKHIPAPWTADGEIILRDRPFLKGVKIYHNGYHIGTWIEYEWEGTQTPQVSLITKAPDMHALIMQALNNMTRDTRVASKEELAWMEKAVKLLYEIKPDMKGRE